jgi:hypothetical protein
MRLARRASLVVVLLVLASVGIAWAECAWVLWRYEVITLATSPGIPSSATWAIDDTADTQASCDGLLAKAVAKSATEPDVQKVFPAGVIYQRNNIVRARNYTCLPDNIDPRGPKGGAR